MRKVLAGVCLICSFSTANAQSTIFENCAAVITGGLREYSVATDSASYLNSVYDKYCDVSGLTKSTAATAGIGIVVELLPIEFTGAYSSSDVAMRNFCREYRSNSASRTTSRTYEDRIVQRAYDSFDACIALASAGIVSRHKVESIERVNFYLAPGFGRPVTVRGINTTPNVTCLGIDPNAAAGSSAIEFDANSVLTLSNTNVLGMVCSRTANSDKDGNRVFEEGVVTVLTDVSPNGNYSIFMPRDVRLADNLATLVQTRLEDIQTQVTEQLSQLNATIRASAKAADGEIDLYGPFVTELRGFDCPAGQYVSGIALNVLQPHIVVSGGDSEGKIRTFDRMKVRCSKIGR